MSANVESRFLHKVRYFEKVRRDKDRHAILNFKLRRFHVDLRLLSTDDILLISLIGCGVVDLVVYFVQLEEWAVVAIVLQVIDIFDQPLKDSNVALNRYIKLLSCSVLFKILFEVFHVVEEHQALALEVFLQLPCIIMHCNHNTVTRVNELTAQICGYFIQARRGNFFILNVEILIK